MENLYYGELSSCGVEFGILYEFEMFASDVIVDAESSSELIPF